MGGADTLVGREPELERILGALDDVDRGVPRVVIVSGEAGIGKTRLLTELLLHATQRGHLALAGRGAELERDLPFGPFVSALDDYVASLDEEILGALGAERLQELAVVLPAFSSFASAPRQAERFRSYRAVRRLLEMLSLARPATLVLDDVHWSDRASVELLCHLLGSPPKAPVLIAIAFRPAQLSPALASGLEGASRDEWTERVQLNPLSATACDQLLGDLDPSLRAELRRQSGGVPFYLVELARARREAPRPPLAVPRLGSSVPAAVRAALGAQIGGLSEAARALLDGAAVAGDPFDLDLAFAAAEIAGRDGTRSLDEALTSELVAPADAPRRFRFRHPLVRRAVYELAGAGWRLEAHARLASILAAQGAPPAAFAHHVERSASVGDADAVSILTAAGHAASDPASAARWFAAALRLLPETDRADNHRLDLLAARAMALGVAGEIDDAHDLLCRILTMLPSGSASKRTRLVAFCANVEHHLGIIDESRRRLVDTLAELPHRTSPEAVLLMMELCFSYTVMGENLDQARALASDALGIAQQLRDRALVAGAAAHRTYVAGICPTGEAPAQVDEWARLTDELTDAELAEHLDGPLKLGQGEHLLERSEAAVRHLQRGIDVARATGHDQAVWIMRVIQVTALVPLGRLEEAAQAGDDAVEATRLTNSREQLGWALAARCQAATAAGDLGLAMALVEESERLGRPRIRRPFFAHLGSALAEAMLDAGEHQRVRALVAEAVEAADVPGFMPAGRARLREIAVRAELALGHPREAAAWADSAVEIARETSLAMPTVIARRASAAVVMASGDHARAAELALEAAATAETIGATFESARSWLLAGQALARAGQRDDALPHLLRAEAELAACGASGYRSAAVRELRRLGRRLGPRRGHGVGTLTVRELEVADLVSAGNTTREIAQQLFVSPKTVEAHVAHIFAKLNVSTRRAVGPALLHATNPIPPEH